MKKSIFNALLILMSISCYSQRIEYIQIKHVGITDVPFFTVLIATHQVDNFDQDFSYTRPFIISESEFYLVKTFINSYKFRKVINSGEFGTFAMNIGNIVKSKVVIEKIYYLSSRGLSRLFFTDFLKFCQKNNFNKKLTERINDIKEELAF